MEKIASFTIDHIKLEPGIYVSRRDHIGSETITTFDLRMTSPNDEPVMNTAEVHKIQHLGATFLRTHDVYKEKVIYFGPMGCRTGFYLLTQGMPHEDAIELTRAALRFIAEYEGEVPGATAAECGNYREQDLPGAKAAAARMLPVLEDWTPADLSYEKGEK